MSTHHVAIGVRGLENLGQLLAELDQLESGTEVYAEVRLPRHESGSLRVTVTILPGPDGKHYAVFADPDEFAIGRLLEDLEGEE